MTPLDVILNGLRDTLPPEDKEEEKILQEKDKRRDMWKLKTAISQQ